MSGDTPSPMGRMRSGPTSLLWSVLLLASSAWFVTACGGYSGRMMEIRYAVEDNDLVFALDQLDQLVAEGVEGQSPQDKDLPLLLLERGAIYQALGEHALAVRDFGEADQMLEALDLTPDGAGAAGEYLWSDSAQLYRPPIYEKLMVNVTSLASYLASGDYTGARVEARRILVLTEFFDGTDLWEHPMLGTAFYMAGLAFELGGEESSAVRAYIDAYTRVNIPGLAETVVRLSQGTTLANHGAVTDAREELGIDADFEFGEPEEEVVVIAFSGLAPFRVAERFPIGAVIAWYRPYSYSMTAEQEAAYNRAVAEDLLTWINFPTLIRYENRVKQVGVSASGGREQAVLVGDIEEFALEQWEDERPGIAFAAVTRAIVRIIAREAVQGIGRAADNGNGVGQAIGFLAGLATQGAMQAADQPDTRTWSFMPAYIWVSRLEVEPGEQTVSVNAPGAGMDANRRFVVDVPENGTAVVTVRYFR